MQAESYKINNGNTIPNDSKKPILDRCLDSIIRREGYISYNVEKKPISTGGGNYLGNLYDIKIKGKTLKGEKETHIFVKFKAPDAADMQIISLDDIYVKELFMYSELFKVFDEMQDEAKIPINERFKTVKSYDESNPNAIILENISNKGFGTRYRMDCVSLDMAEASIKQLAKFHSLSFMIKNRRPEYFDNKIKPLNQPFIFGKGWEAFKIKYTKNTLRFLEGDMRRRAEDKIPGVLEKFPQYILDEDSKCCVCHGDYRLNNIMVKEKDGKILDVILVDYQLIHYGCPIYDFLYFMYTGCDFEFRQKHTSYLKDLYFETLEKYLLHFNISVESVYPRKSFEKAFEEKRDYGLILSVLCLPLVFAFEGDAPESSKDAFSEMNISLDERFRDRFIGAIQEFIELGYL